MTSHIEIAQAKNVSVKDIHAKSIALNQTYFLDVFKSGFDGKWHGGVWEKQDCAKCRKDDCRGCVRRVLTLEEGFNKPQHAACYLNKSMDTLQLTADEENQLGLTASDLALLKKLAVRPSEKEKAQAFQMKKSFERTLY